MFGRSSIKILFCLALSMPASALQSDHDDTLIKFRPDYGNQGPVAAYQAQPGNFAQFDENDLDVFFSILSIAMIMLAIRGQQRQDYTQFRDPQND